MNHTSPPPGTPNPIPESIRPHDLVSDEQAETDSPAQTRVDQLTHPINGRLEAQS